MKKIELNRKKTKIMIFGENRGRKKMNKKVWKWMNEELEQVKKIKYLGYLLTTDNKDKEHVKEQAAKARTVLGKIWYKGKRNFENDQKKRKLIFAALSKSILLYGEEIWGFDEYEEIEKIKKKYIKWVFELDRNTPDYVLRRELKENSLFIDTVERALKYEEKIIVEKNESLMMEILRRKELKIGQQNQMEKTREKIIGKNKNIEDRREKVITELKKEEKDKDMESIKKSTYLYELKEILWNEWEKYDIPLYLKEKKDIRIIARFRLGSENRASKYWKKDEEKICRICNGGEETIKHVIEICNFTNVGKSVQNFLDGDGRGHGFMHGIVWKRKRKEG